MSESCANCRFAHPIEMSDFSGQVDCRRYPPGVQYEPEHKSNIREGWPRPYRIQWCGEWKPVPTPAEQK